MLGFMPRPQQSVNHSDYRGDRIFS